ncbi:MAG: ATP-binding cassette domain-containing protein [Actinomycetota bacterium]|nr:ATP-binding cassette domain-containing protein [Actinomycetota bacterium]
MNITQTYRARSHFVTPRTITAAAIVGGLVVAYGVGYVLLPGHLPAGVAISGLVLGSLEGLVAVGLVLVYRSARIINFAQGQMGALGASAAIIAVASSWHLNYYLALAIGLVVSLATGWAVDAVIGWRLGNAPRLMVTVVTIGIALVLGAIAIVMPEPFHLTQVTSFKAPFNLKFSVGSFTFTGDYVMALIVVAVLVAALYAFFQKTTTGIAIRAAADSPERATLLGIPVRRLSRITWITAAGLSGVGLMLQAPILGQTVGVTSVSPTVLLPPLIAAVFAGMESVPLAFAASLVIGIFQQSVFWSYPHSSWVDFGLLVFAVVALFVQQILVPRHRARTGSLVAGDFEAVSEVRPLPSRWAHMPEVRFGKPVLTAIVIGVAALMPLVLSPSGTNLLTDVAIYGIVAISLVVLTGWGGQISLGQFAFVGVGAATAGSLIAHFQLNLLAALALAGFVGALAALLVGVPALRIPGLYLAVVTLAFADVVSNWLLNSANFPVINPANVPAGTLAGRFDLTSPGTLFEIVLLALIGSYAIARNLRRSRAGRVILAVRENARAASAFSISPLRAKLTAFAVSGALAGVAGGLYVVQLRGIGADGFPPELSLFAVAMVVVGGLGSMPGAVVGAMFVEGVSYFVPGAWQYLLIGLGLTLVPMFFPDGLGALFVDARDRVVGLLAARRGLPAPGDAESELLAGVEPDGSTAEAHGPLAAETAHAAAARFEALEALEAFGKGTPVAGGSQATAASDRAGGEPSAEGGGGGTIAGDGAPAAEPRAEKVLLGSCSEIDASYGALQVLFGVDLDVSEGEVLALLGTNGAGKSTLLRVLSGLMAPGKGRIVFAGRDVTEMSPAERVKVGLVLAPGGRDAFSSLTVAENLRLACWATRHTSPDFAASALEQMLDVFPILKTRYHVRAGLLSGGEQQMLTLAQALLCRPKLLLVDELSLGLAPIVVAQLLDVIRALTAGGMSVVVVEQSVNVATAIADRAVFMDRGRVRFTGPVPSLVRQPQLLRSVFLQAAARAKLHQPAAPGTAPDTEVSGPSAIAAEALARLLDPVEALLRKPGPVGSAHGPRPASATPPPPLPPPPPPPPPPVSTGPFAGLRTARPAVTGSPLHGTFAVPALAAAGVGKRYGGVAALTDVSFAVQPGEILGVIGANGAGKTTLFDVCSGFVRPDQGRVLMGGIELTDLPPQERARRRLGRVFQDARLFPSLTVADALAIALERSVEVRDPLASALGVNAVRESEEDVALRVDGILSEMELGKWRHHKVSELSIGTRRLLELACALAHEPRVLLLDEPSAGIAQAETEALGELLMGLRQQTGAAMVVIEHDVPLVASIADRLVCLHLGSVIASGPTSEVLDDPAVVAAYLGADQSSITRSRTVGAGR